MAEFTEQQFVKWVRKAELEAAENIRSYKFKLALFAVLGYVVIFGLLFTLILLVGGTVGLAFVSTTFFLLMIKNKVIFAVLVAIWVLLKALWIKIEAPVGLTLKREDFPALFTEIDDLSNTLNALKIHQVILDENLNAAVIQHPRFGILGGQKNTLILGLQLLLTRSPLEMRSVLAHEFGHLSGNHSRFSGWIYRIRMTWQRVMHAFASNKSFGAILLKLFFDWYSPKFLAYSFVLARNNEYEADRISVDLTSAEVATSALVSIHATAPYIDENYWTQLIKQADTVPEPPGRPYQGLANFLKNSPIGRGELEQRMNKALEIETHYANTHPALKDRIAAITSHVVVPDPIDNNAAEVWLGSEYQAILDQFDGNWIRSHQEQWKNRYEYVARAKQSLEKYAQKEIGSLSDEELWEYASWTREFESADDALALYCAFQKRHPDSVGAAYYIGIALAERNDLIALSHLRIAFGSPETLENAARCGYDLLQQQGEKDQAESWMAEALAANQVHNNASAERAQVTPKDEFESPVIDDDLLEKLVRQLKAHKNVKSVWLAQKVLQYTPESPVYIAVIQNKGFYWSSSSVIQKIAGEIEVGVDLFMVSLWGDTRKLGRKVIKTGIKIV